MAVLTSSHRPYLLTRWAKAQEQRGLLLALLLLQQSQYPPNSEDDILPARYVYFRLPGYKVAILDDFAWEPQESVHFTVREFLPDLIKDMLRTVCMVATWLLATLAAPPEPPRAALTTRVVVSPPPPDNLVLLRIPTTAPNAPAAL